jgi:aspartate aminotransferase
MASLASETFTSTSAPIQYAAIRAFRGGVDIERYLSNIRKILKALGSKIHKDLNKNHIVSPAPEGGFYLFINFKKHLSSLRKKGITTSDELTKILLEDTGVAILPGSAFGRPPDELTARIAYVDFDGAKALAAVEALPPHKQVDDSFLQAHCSHLLEGVTQLCDWTKK